MGRAYYKLLRRAAWKNNHRSTEIAGSAARQPRVPVSQLARTLAVDRFHRIIATQLCRGRPPMRNTNIELASLCSTIVMASAARFRVGHRTARAYFLACGHYGRPRGRTPRPWS